MSFFNLSVSALIALLPMIAGAHDCSPQRIAGGARRALERAQSLNLYEANGVLTEALVRIQRECNSDYYPDPKPIAYRCRVTKSDTPLWRSATGLQMHGKLGYGTELYFLGERDFDYRYNLPVILVRVDRYSSDLPGVEGWVILNQTDCER